MGVRDQLASLGTDLGTFDQVDFGKAYSSIAGVNPADGYCAGVCLDWTRRVLQSGANRDARFLNYSSPKNALVATNNETRQTKTLRRMATAFSGQGASYVTKTRQTSIIEQLTALLQQPDSDWTIDGKDFTGLPVANDLAKLVSQRMVITPNPFNMLKEPAAVVSREKVQSWLNFVNGSADPQHSKLADGGREWGQYASELDAKFANKKRRFSNLYVVMSSNQQTYGSEGAWMGELLANGFQPNRCTIVGVGAPGDEGHAVAVHVYEGDYRFFDPNYGAFKYTKEKLKNALQHLFWAPFFQGETGLDADLPVYRRRSNASKPKDTKPWVRMSYTIFGA